MHVFDRLVIWPQKTTLVAYGYQRFRRDICTQKSAKIRTLNVVSDRRPGEGSKRRGCPSSLGENVESMRALFKCNLVRYCANFYENYCQLLITHSLNCGGAET